MPPNTVVRIKALWYRFYLEFTMLVGCAQRSRYAYICCFLERRPYPVGEKVFSLAGHKLAS